MAKGILIVVVTTFIVASAVTLTVRLVVSREPTPRQRGEERMAFLKLGGFAKEMIQQRGPGIVGENDDPHIRSFDDFYDHMSLHYPHLVSARDAPNPFPGILPGKNYSRTTGPLRDAKDLLIWKDETFREPVGDIQLRLSGRGGVLILKNSDVEN